MLAQASAVVAKRPGFHRKCPSNADGFYPECECRDGFEYNENFNACINIYGSFRDTICQHHLLLQTIAVSREGIMYIAKSTRCVSEHVLEMLAGKLKCRPKSEISSKVWNNFFPLKNLARL